jgi:hypothetical protein
VRPALGAWATRPGHTVNMLAPEERLCMQATPWRSIHAAPRTTAVRATAGSSSYFQSLRALPASRTVAG